MRLQEHLPSSAGAAKTCCCSCAASPAGQRGTGATTLAGSRPSFPLPVPLGLQHPSDTRGTRIHRASKGKSCTTSQPGLSSDQGPLLRYLTHNRSEVYSKRTIITLKIKLDKTCFGSTLPTAHANALSSKQRGTFQPPCPSVTGGCFVVLLPLLELHSA